MGETFGPFELVERLGSGGMAEVWRALYRGGAADGFAKEVAVKRILPHRLEEPDLRTWFEDEARIGSRLRHPNIVEVYDFGEAEGAPFLSMELIEGWSLGQVLDRCRATGANLPLEAVVALGLQACDGLAYAHEAVDPRGNELRVVHRDLKPGNLMLDRGGRVRVMDFGIAKATTNAFLTQTDVVRGTPCYMSPELCEGLAADLRSDLFSLAAILAEAVLGDPIFLEDSPYRTMHRIVHGDAASELAVIAEASPALAGALDTALQSEPGNRHADAAVFRAALEPAASPDGDEVLRATVRELMQRSAPVTDGGSTRLLPPTLAEQTDPVVPDTEEFRSKPTPPVWLVVGAAILVVVAGLLWFRPWAPGEGASPAPPPPGIDGGSEAIDPAVEVANVDARADAAASEDTTPAPTVEQPVEVVDPGEPAEFPTEAPADEPTPAEDVDPTAEVEPAEEPPADSGFVWRERDPAAVQAQVQSDAAVAACFEAAGEDGPDAARIAFTIKADGSFGALRMTDTSMTASPAGTCILDRLRQMPFDGASVDYSGTMVIRHLDLPELPEGLE
jgi:eukaryotic-like serine/threonine-protein kinase